MALAVVWRITKGGGGSAVEELSKANEVLTKRVQDLGAEVRDLQVENVELKSRTDYQSVLDDFDRRAEERHLALMKTSQVQTSILSMIADRLGSDGS